MRKESVRELVNLRDDRLRCEIRDQVSAPLRCVESDLRALLNYLGLTVVEANLLNADRMVIKSSEVRAYERRLAGLDE